MINILKTFLKSRHEKESPLLLAFSGGPDSLALLHLLIECSKTFPLKFAIAHVDHGWRTESKAEALEISRMADQLGISYYLQTLNPSDMTGNLEAACREERYRFFASLCLEHGFQAVLLAHHADDLAETVLKRTLEGVTLPYLAALRPETEIYGVKVWRPLLPISKIRLQEWLQERKLQGFIDKTNVDTKYLRAKMRVQMLPFLSETFGKKISSGLCRIAEEAGELRDYLDRQIDPYLANIVVKDKQEYFMDLSVDCPSDPFELKYLIRQFCKQCAFGLSRDCVNKAAKFVLEKSIHKSFLTKKGKLHIDRRKLKISLL
jgi:tRNA(Ile)-lysidine synthase